MASNFSKGSNKTIFYAFQQNIVRLCKIIEFGSFSG